MDLREIKAYLFCPLWYYLKHRPIPLADEAGLHRSVPAYSTLDLPGLAISQALAVHAAGEHPYSFPVLVEAVWKAWLAEKGVGEDVAQALKNYARIRNQILRQFLEGRITNREHRPYIEPRMTTRYKEAHRNAGLERISRGIDETALAKLGCTLAELAGMGPYSLASAYADSLLMSSRYTPPLPETIHGLQVQTLVPLPNKRTITATADLVLLGTDTATIEVHDFDPAFAVQLSWVGRRLEVIAALGMQAADPAKPFPRVERAVYRHFLSGKTVERRSVRDARLVFALEAAVRGIEAGIFTPQFLSGDLSRCRGCPGREVCIPASGDLVEWFLPGEAEVAKAIYQSSYVK